MSNPRIHSIGSYIQVQCAGGESFGGSQLWFEEKGSFPDRTRHMGGCGLVAVGDFILYYCMKKGIDLRASKSPLFGGEHFPALPTPEAPLFNQAEYLSFLRHLSSHGYPILPKLGSFSFEMAAFLNLFLSSVGAKERVRFLWQNDPKKRLRLAEASIERGYPCPLIIGPHFLSPGKRGVNFYRMQPDGKLILSHRNVRGHFVMLTGICRYDALNKPLLFEISSWGQRLYLSSEEYTAYIRKHSSPIVAGMFTLSDVQ